MKRFLGKMECLQMTVLLAMMLAATVIGQQACSTNNCGTDAACQSNSDCPANRACSNSECVDPCSNACGLNAQCEVKNHVPSCTCLPAYSGDPFSECHSIEN